MKGEYLKLETVKTIAELLTENKELRQEVERLNNIIKKAVEYIEYMQDISENKNIYVSVYDLVKLLKGEDKE